MQAPWSVLAALLASAASRHPRFGPLVLLL